MTTYLPLQTENFKIKFPSLNSDEFGDNTEDVHIDFIGKVVSVTVRQGPEPKQFDAIEEILRFKYEPEIHAYSVGGMLLMIFYVNHAELERHTMHFDYSDKGHLVHNLRWKFEGIDARLPVYETEDDESNFVLTPGFISPADAVKIMEHKLTSQEPTPKSIIDDLFEGDRETFVTTKRLRPDSQ
jgi:hypothetical protein